MENIFIRNPESFKTVNTNISLLLDKVDNLFQRISVIVYDIPWVIVSSTSFVFVFTFIIQLAILLLTKYVQNYEPISRENTNKLNAFCFWLMSNKTLKFCLLSVL